MNFKLLLTIFVVLVAMITGCIDGPDSTIIAEITATCPDVSITPIVAKVYKGNTIFLATNVNRRNTKFLWTVTKGTLSDSVSATPDYTATEIGPVTISVEIMSSCGVDSAVIEIIVLDLPTITPTWALTPTLIPSPTCSPIDVSIALETTKLVVGESISLEADVNGDVIVEWEVTSGELSDPGDLSPSYTATEPGDFTIGIRAIDLCGNTTSAQTKIHVDKQVTLTPTATTTPMPTPTATPQLPTIPPVTLSPEPVIVSKTLEPGGGFKVCWTWENELANDQSFAVRFWNKDDTRPKARYSITWTDSDYCYRFQVGNQQYPPGFYWLNVAVMQGKSDGDHYEVVVSQSELVEIPPIPPTLPPPPPPQ